MATGKDTTFIQYSVKTNLTAGEKGLQAYLPFSKKAAQKVRALTLIQRTKIQIPPKKSIRWYRKCCESLIFAVFCCILQYEFYEMLTLLFTIWLFWYLFISKKDVLHSDVPHILDDDD